MQLAIQIPSYPLPHYHGSQSLKPRMEANVHSVVHDLRAALAHTPRTLQTVQHNNNYPSTSQADHTIKQESCSPPYISPTYSNLSATQSLQSAVPDVASNLYPADLTDPNPCRSTFPNFPTAFANSRRMSEPALTSTARYSHKYPDSHPYPPLDSVSDHHQMHHLPSTYEDPHQDGSASPDYYADSPGAAPYQTSDDVYNMSPGTATSTSSSIPIISPGTSAASDRDRYHPSDDSSGSPTDPSKTYSFVSLPGNSMKKRPRRRYDEIERLYQCSWQDCTKAYGTLNHLNAHVTMQKHGVKRSPQEFKELRKQWRKARKEADLTHAQGVKQEDMQPAHQSHVPYLDQYPSPHQRHHSDIPHSSLRYSASSEDMSSEQRQGVHLERWPASLPPQTPSSSWPNNPGPSTRIPQHPYMPSPYASPPFPSVPGVSAQYSAPRYSAEHRIQSDVDGPLLTPQSMYQPQPSHHPSRSSPLPPLSVSNSHPYFPYYEYDAGPRSAPAANYNHRNYAD